MMLLEDKSEDRKVVHLEDYIRATTRPDSLKQAMCVTKARQVLSWQTACKRIRERHFRLFKRSNPSDDKAQSSHT